MPYNEELNTRIHTAVSGWKKVTAKKMFGGVGHLLNGNMFCGVHTDHLILRLGETQAADALKKPFVKPFDITGRPMKGWVMVAPAGCDTDKTLTGWLRKAKSFVTTLPPK